MKKSEYWYLSRWLISCAWFYGNAAFPYEKSIPQWSIEGIGSKVGYCIIKSENDYDTRSVIYHICTVGCLFRCWDFSLCEEKQPFIYWFCSRFNHIDWQCIHSYCKMFWNRKKHADVIAVVHHLTSIREFERIVVLRNGKIVGNGTFDELLGNNSYFFDLYRNEKENSN